MAITIESLKNQLNQLQQQRTAAANMAQQCAGAIGVLQRQLEELCKEAKESELKKAEEEAQKLKESQDGEANEQGTQEAA